MEWINFASDLGLKIKRVNNSKTLNIIYDQVDILTIKRYLSVTKKEHIAFLNIHNSDFDFVVRIRIKPHEAVYLVKYYDLKELPR